jgi:hypothetical protein
MNTFKRFVLTAHQHKLWGVSALCHRSDSSGDPHALLMDLYEHLLAKRLSPDTKLSTVLLLTNQPTNQPTN